MLNKKINSIIGRDKANSSYKAFKCGLIRCG
nr:MAG TPA: hypothetical protein [Caudoviricetes sp.]